MGHSLPETQPQNIARQLADDKKKDCSNTANDVSGTYRILRIFEIRFAEKAAQPNSNHGGMTELKEDNLRQSSFSSVAKYFETVVSAVSPHTGN